MTDDLATTIDDVVRRLDAVEKTLARITIFSRDAAEPPLPPKTSRKQQGEKIDIRARVDGVLYNLLSLDARRQSGGNLSRQLDIVLWRYYGKPKLTWELDQID